VNPRNDAGELTTDGREGVWASNDAMGARTFSRPQLVFAQLAAVNAEPQVPHLQFVNELATALDLRGS